MFMFLVHGLVVLSTCCDDMHGKFSNGFMWCGLSLCALCWIYGLYDEVLTWHEWSCLFLSCSCIKWMVNVCGLLIGLLSMCEVMGFHMCIALVDLDLGSWVRSYNVKCEVKLAYVQVGYGSL